MPNPLGSFNRTRRTYSAPAAIHYLLCSRQGYPTHRAPGLRQSLGT